MGSIRIILFGELNWWALYEIKVNETEFWLKYECDNCKLLLVSQIDSSLLNTLSGGSQDKISRVTRFLCGGLLMACNRSPICFSLFLFCDFFFIIFSLTWSLDIFFLVWRKQYMQKREGWKIREEKKSESWWERETKGWWNVQRGVKMMRDKGERAVILPYLSTHGVWYIS